MLRNEKSYETRKSRLSYFRSYALIQWHWGIAPEREMRLAQQRFRISQRRSKYKYST